MFPYMVAENAVFVVLELVSQHPDWCRNPTATEQREIDTLKADRDSKQQARDLYNEQLPQ
jgi:hypothetical protein